MLPAMRISDAERQRAVDELRRHCAAGRVDIDEYAERIEKVMGSSTLEELDGVLGDLPMLRIDDPTSSAGAGRIGWLGARALESGSEPRARRRPGPVLGMLVAVLVVVLAAVLLVAASWVWAAVLVAGWVAGLAQSSLSRRSH